MHVAVDAHNLVADRRGIGVYLRAVLSRMLKSGACQLTLLVRHPLPTLKKHALATELGSDAFGVSSRMPRTADVAWHPWNGTFFRGAARNVVTMHDVVPFAFPNSDARKRRSQQEPFELSARIADRILADSAFTKNEIERYLNVEPGRMEVVPLAASGAFSPGRAQELPAMLRQRRYILYVGTLEAHKNVETLLRAWRGSLASRGIALAIVGTEAVPQDVIGLRGVIDSELRDLYRGALCLAYPSLYEGFGLPPLEALACGTPAIVARAASLPEVCGDAVAYVDEPRSVAAWEAALTRIADDDALRNDLARRGPIQAATFSWERTTQATLAALSEVAR